MFVALTKYEDELSQYLEKAVLLTPCTIIGANTEPDLSEGAMNSVQWFREELGIQAMVGPTWDDDVEKICEVVDR